MLFTVCVCVCVCVCVFENPPVKDGGRELVHCTLSQGNFSFLFFFGCICLCVICLSQTDLCSA